MCIVVDADVAHKLHGGDADGRHVTRWLFEGRGGLIVGGKLTIELFKAGLGDAMVQLERANRLHRIPAEVISEEVKKLKGRCASNDLHVIAILRVSQCDLLFSGDKKLHKDVKNNSVMDHAVSIYQKSKHRKLLIECKCF